MNREERRKLVKNEKVITEWVKSFEGVEDSNLIPEGTKVKIDYKKMSIRPNFINGLQGYKDFVEQHKDDVFTVEYDPKHPKDPYLVCFREDTNNPKWLFLITELIRMDKENSNG